MILLPPEINDAMKDIKEAYLEDNTNIWLD